MDFRRLENQQDVQYIISWHNANLDIPLVIDTETTSVDPRKAELLDIQISGSLEEEAYLFPASFRNSLLAIDRRKTLIAHHYPFDAHVLFRHGVDLLDRNWRDTLIQAHLIDENRDSNSLESFVKEYWNDSYKQYFWETHKTYQEASKEEQLKYACKDIVYTRKLYAKQQEQMWAQDVPDSLLSLVHRLQKHLLRTQIEGVCVDLNYLLKKSVELKTQIDSLLPEMRSLVEIPCQILEMEAYEKALAKYKTDKGKANAKRPAFSFGSSAQLQRLLYGVLNLPVQTNEKTKSVSVDESALEKIREQHPLIPKLLEYRGHQKIYTAFIEGTESRLEGGRIYPSFNVGGTATGRISHSNPNLAQLPKAGGIRGIYIPSPGHVLLSADYSQLEVCLEANITRDPNTVKIFKEGLSKHDVTAQGLGISRDQAKTLNFAMGYHCSHFKVSKLLGVSIPKAKEVWNKYWEVYTGCKALKAKTDRMVDEGVPLVTLYGRKRRFEKRERQVWDGDYRQAYNFLIQGLGADITSEAFVIVCDKLAKEGWGRPLWTVHDEIILEVKKEFAAAAEEFMLKTMVGVGERLGLQIPLKAEGSGPQERWMD